ncbi:MAG: IPT/TIG domain-containing protein [Planctomycetes bacterium]|nr:IPT/TIG domain-containing protein [Planctomycetota bacterium]
MNRSFTAAITAFVLLAVASSALAIEAPTKDKLTDEQKRKLEAGEILTATEVAAGVLARTGYAIAIVDAAPMRALACVTSYDTLSTFMPNLWGSRIIDQVSRDVTKYEGIVKADIIGFSIEYRYVNRAVQDLVNYTVTWDLLEGDLRRNEGSWKFVPWNEAGTKTLVTYQLLLDVGTALIPEPVQEYMIGENLPAVLRAVKEEVSSADYDARTNELSRRRERLLNPGGTADDSPPNIERISRQNVKPGEVLYIFGRHFSADQNNVIVFLGDSSVRILRTTTTVIAVEIPADAQSGQLTVRTEAGESAAVRVNIVREDD